MKKPPEDRNGRLAWRVLSGAARASTKQRNELRYHVVRDSWTIMKRFGEVDIDNVEYREIPCVREAVIEGYIDDPNRVVIAALCQGLGARTFFEIGSNRGRTTWTVARNNPELELYTLDLPDQEAAKDVTFEVTEADRGLFIEEWDRGEAFAGKPEADRITQLWGDSAKFDFSPYEGKMDVVFVDGAHTYSYVRNDTEAAMRLLTDRGTIIWDDYPTIAGIYRYLGELAPTLDPPPFHILGTRMVVYSRAPLLERLGDNDYGRIEKA